MRKCTVNLSPFPHSLSISSPFPHSLSISSFALHFLIRSPFPLHFLILSIFLQPGCQAATICATLIGWNILKRIMLSKSVKKNRFFESDKDGRQSRPSVGWLVLPFGRAVVFPPVNSCAINTQRERLEIFYSASFTILEENIAEYRTQQVQFNSI